MDEPLCRIEVTLFSCPNNVPHKYPTGITRRHSNPSGRGENIKIPPAGMESWNRKIKYLRIKPTTLYWNYPGYKPGADSGSD
jgi:hypothetical protein